jgi:hypothetical protein
MRLRHSPLSAQQIGGVAMVSAELGVSIAEARDATMSS